MWYNISIEFILVAYVFAMELIIIMRYVIKRKNFKFSYPIVKDSELDIFKDNKELMRVLVTKINIEGVAGLIGFRCKRIIVKNGYRKFVIFSRKLFVTDNEYFTACIFERINGDGIIFVNFKEE